MCVKSQQTLLQNKILYPKYNGADENYFQHSSVAWISQMRDLKSLRNFIEATFNHSSKENCKVSLLSGEDFENFLVDIHLAIEFEDIAKSVGYSEVEWIVVHRSPIDYLLSIYSEKSAYKVVLDIGLMANAILKYGFFVASSPEYNYKFVFDIKKFSELFMNNVSPNLRVVEFNSFIKGFPGKPILGQLVDEKSLKKLKENSNSIGIKRKRLPKERVEFRYIANFLGMNADKDFHENNKSLVDSLIAHRLNRNELLLEEIEAKFKEKFGF